MTIENELSIDTTLDIPDISDPDLFDPFCDENHPRAISMTDILDAHERIKEAIPTTPCSAEAKRGVIAASAGNHAQGLAYHGGMMGIPVVVVLPTMAPQVKINNCRRLGAKVLLLGKEFDEARRCALKLSKLHNLTYVNGYDHPLILAGQGTVGLEIMQQVPDVDAVIVPCGGGGLISGVAVAVKHIKPQVEVIGVESKQCNAFAVSLGEGKAIRVPLKPTIADGLAVSYPGHNCIYTCKSLVDRMIAVDEEWIQSAMLSLVEKEKCIAEGAGATALAALLSGKLDDLKGKKVVAIISGGNVDTKTLIRSLDRAMIREQHANAKTLDHSGFLGMKNGFVYDATLGVPDPDDPDLFDPNCDAEHPVAINMNDILDAHDNIHKAIPVTPCLEEARRGVIAASAGNHAQALAYHGGMMGIPVVVVMPTIAPEVKVNNCRRLGAKVLLLGKEFDEARRFALKLAKLHNLVYINGYDHPLILAGQGTVGLEIMQQVLDVDAVLVPCGGGGLISGIAVAVKHLNPKVEVIGVESIQSNAFAISLKAGKVTYVPLRTTIADGLAVSYPGHNCIYTCKSLVDRMIAVDEEWIQSAMLSLVEKEKCIAEGAGATALAALLSGKLDDLKGKKVVAIVSGGNVDTTVLIRSLDRALVRDQRLCRFTVTVSDRPNKLVELCGLVGGLGVNIRKITHQRPWTNGSAYLTEVTVTCETEGAQQREALYSALFKKYHSVKWPSME